MYDYPEHTSAIDELIAQNATLEDMQMAAALRLTRGIIGEIRGNGPIFAYLDNLRSEALESVKGLPKIHAGDISAVQAVQHAVGKYLDLCEWIERALSVAANAERAEEPEAEDEAPRHRTRRRRRQTPGDDGAGAPDA